VRDSALYTQRTVGGVNFLDATEEEAIDLVRSLMNQLAIMSSCMVIPSEKKKSLNASIVSFEAYLNYLPSEN
jgi:hypothetical protein